MMMTPAAWGVVVRTMKANPTTCDDLIYEVNNDCDSNAFTLEALSTELLECGIGLLKMRSGLFGAPKRVSKMTDAEMWQGMYYRHRRLT